MRFRWYSAAGKREAVCVYACTVIYSQLLVWKVAAPPCSAVFPSLYSGRRRAPWCLSPPPDHSPDAYLGVWSWAEDHTQTHKVGEVKYLYAFPNGPTYRGCEISHLPIFGAVRLTAWTGFLKWPQEAALRESSYRCCPLPQIFAKQQCGAFSSSSFGQQL